MNCERCGALVQWSDLRSNFVCPNGHVHPNTEAPATNKQQPTTIRGP